MLHYEEGAVLLPDGSMRLPGSGLTPEGYAKALPGLIDDVRLAITHAAGGHITPFGPADWALAHLEDCETAVLKMINPNEESDD